MAGSGMDAGQAILFDVIVIGGGFAGAAAARELGVQGKRVLLLEARDRLGGRTWMRPFAGAGPELEFGGQWIAPRWQPHMSALLERYHLPVAHDPPPTTHVYLAGGARHVGGLPVPPEEILDAERAIYILIHAARRLHPRAPLHDPPADLDIPFSDFLAEMALPPATHDYLAAWVIGMFGCALHAVSTINVLAWVADYDYSVLAIHFGASETFATGTRSAINALIQESGATVLTGSPVSSVAQDRQGVAVRTQQGQTFRAAAVVMAVGLNVLGDIAFSPALSDARQSMATEGHAGHAVKVWMSVRGVPSHFHGTGMGPELVWLAGQRELPEGSLLLGFGPGPDMVDMEDLDAIQRNVDAFVPGAEVLCVDAHDWSRDPYAKGAWVAYRPGQLSRHGAALRRPEGRIAFAGSDISTTWAGWMEGALASGVAAAAQVQAICTSP